MTIVVAGEALIDLVLGPGGELTAHAGGGPFTVARTLGRLERPVRYLGRLSTDRFGQRLRAALADDGVALDAAVATDDPTTLALAEIDSAGAASYRFYTEGTSTPGLVTEDARAGDDASMLCVGALGLVLEPMATALEAAVAAAPEQTLVLLDPNCRPAVIADPGGYRARLSRVLGRADAVKVSDDDLAWLAPGEDPLDAAESLLTGGAAVALVTRGGEDAVVVTRSDRVPVAVPSVRVVDTIGAGDVFAGGFLAWWHRSGLGREELARLESVVAATEFACLVAARTCSRAGAVPPLASELE